MKRQSKKTNLIRIELTGSSDLFVVKIVDLSDAFGRSGRCFIGLKSRSCFRCRWSRVRETAGAATTRLHEVKLRLFPTTGHEQPAASLTKVKVTAT